MPRNRSFWIDIFKKSPLIASLMVLGGLIGLGMGIFWFGMHTTTTRAEMRVIGGLIAGSSCGGVFVGLILGVVLDSVFGMFRDDKKKRRRDDDPYRNW
ncbi:MAG TPA: hypothetical protein VFE62_21420 [Gemmataceae bacterium]|nr:hypothetical protein [Gemmataceae bacterium]